MPDQQTPIPEESPRPAEWLERPRDPVQRPRLVEHLFRTAGEPEDKSDESAAGGVVAMLRRQNTKLAEAERELREQTAKLEAVEEELREVKELARARREAEETEEHEPEQASAPQSHLLFVPEATGYGLLDAPGESPSLGSVILLGDESSRFLVTRVGPSPFPGDARRCAYLLRLS